MAGDYSAASRWGLGPGGLVELVLRLQEGRAPPHAILGVSQGDSLDAAKSAYRKHALHLHPDKNSHERCVEAFKAVSEAMEAIQRNPQLGYHPNGSKDNKWEAFTDDGDGGFQPQGPRPSAPDTRPAHGDKSHSNQTSEPQAPDPAVQAAKAAWGARRTARPARSAPRADEPTATGWPTGGLGVAASSSRRWASNAEDLWTSTTPRKPAAAEPSQVETSGLRQTATEANRDQSSEAAGPSRGRSYSAMAAAGQSSFLRPKAPSSAPLAPVEVPARTSGQQVGRSSKASASTWVRPSNRRVTGVPGLVFERASTADTAAHRMCPPSPEHAGQHQQQQHQQQPADEDCRGASCRSDDVWETMYADFDAGNLSSGEDHSLLEDGCPLGDFCAGVDEEGTSGSENDGPGPPPSQPPSPLHGASQCSTLPAAWYKSVVRPSANCSSRTGSKLLQLLQEGEADARSSCASQAKKAPSGGWKRQRRWANKKAKKANSKRSHTATAQQTLHDLF